MIVDIVAHTLYQLWDQMAFNRSVGAAGNLNPGRTPIPRIWAYAIQCFPMKAEDGGWAQLECASINCGFNYSDANVVLAKAVFSLGLRFQLGVDNKVRFERATMPLLPVIRHSSRRQESPPADPPFLA